MERGQLPRKLAVILHADVVASTELVRHDEALAHQRIRDVFNRLTATIEAYGGIAHEVRGDALVAEFARASDAVCAALAFQAANRQFNATLDDAVRPQMRIGIALSEVIIDGHTLTGEGVVLAQRLEQLAEAGAVCIQGSVHEAVPGRLPFDYADLGERTLKGFEAPLKVYTVTLKPGAIIPQPDLGAGAASRSTQRMRKHHVAAGALTLAIGVGLVAWLTPWQLVDEETASIDRMAFPLPDKPSIAVLPFANMSGDPEQEYFVDGMTEDLITDISKLSGLFVIARNSVFTYKGRPVGVAQVAEELGVRYILEGSVRRVGDQVRINAQLIDATTGGQLWAERYDGSLADVFGLQDEISAQIVTALAINLTVTEKADEQAVETENPEAYDEFLKGWAHFRRGTPEDYTRARVHLERAIALDSGYSRAYAALAALYWETHTRRWLPALAIDATTVKQRAYEYRDRAMAEPTPLALVVASDMLIWRGGHEEAVVLATRAVESAPNDAYAKLELAKILVYAGQPQDAGDYIRAAARLDPLGEAEQLYLRGLAAFGMEQFEAAAALLERALELKPDFPKPTAILAATYAYLGRADALDVLKPYENERWGGAVVSAALQFPYKHDQDRLRLEEGLRRAGLKEFY